MNKLLETIGQQVQPMDSIDCRDYLNELFQQIKATAPETSLQKFADALGIGSASNLHKLLTGARVMGRRTGDKIAQAVGLQGNQKKYFDLLVQLKNVSKAADQELLIEQLYKLRSQSRKHSIEGDFQELHRQWYHFIILELLRLPGIDQSASALAEQVVPRLRPKQVEESINLLIKLGLVKYDPQQARLVGDDMALQTAQETDSLLAIRYHHRVMDIAKQAIADIPEEHREISTTTLRVTEKQLSAMKDAIYALQMQFIDQEAPPEKTERVVFLNFQVIPASLKVKVSQEADSDASDLSDLESAG